MYGRIFKEIEKYSKIGVRVHNEFQSETALNKLIDDRNERKNNMVVVTPCFNLNGQCEEAITLYKKAFGATTKFILRYSDADKGDWSVPLTDDQKNMVYHAEMIIGNQRIMFSDIIEFELSKGTSLFLTITFEDAESVKKAYEFMKEGSKVVYPMVSTTYSSCFVSLIDKFGFRWVLMTEQTEK